MFRAYIVFGEAQITPLDNFYLMCPSFHVESGVYVFANYFYGRNNSISLALKYPIKQHYAIRNEDV